jgi:D-3-phosphoglycerate dehydrogenase / 2-oxoglutarate reductase
VPRVVVTDATFPRLDHERAVAMRFGAKLEEARCVSEDDVVNAAFGTDVLFVQFAKVTRKAMSKLAPNALIIRYGIGLDNLDLAAARELGIKVVYVPDYATGEVADHTAALILTALRKIIPLDKSVRDGAWDTVGTAKPVKGFSESVAGFVGFGRIGREVHARLRPFGFSSIVSDPYTSESVLSEVGTRGVDLDTLFSTADVITLHAPLTPATHHIVNARRLSQMKSTAVVVNTARGGLIDAEALAEALQAKQIGGAALDVFEREPLPADSPLRRLSNVILTPHAAWYSTRSVEQLQALAADEMDRHLSGKAPRCPAPMPV